MRKSNPFRHAMFVMAVAFRANDAFTLEAKKVVKASALFQKKASSYDDTDGASKGLVSSLTGLVNSLNTLNEAAGYTEGTKLKCPTSPEELCNRIRDDYVANNYLWTGKLDLDCFEDSCRFTDPTLSFVGTETFKKNTNSLVPLVIALVENYESLLLDIELHPDFIETRWNMVGELNGLFWKPKIDVIGRTKFWYRDDSNLVYFYDEKWEVPAYQALLQLVTPADTFPNTLLSSE